MPVQNAEVADILNRVADLLEIDEANPFRVRAYRNAARTVAGLSQSLAALVARGADLSRLPTIGKDLAGKIAEIVETGELPALRELERHMPAGLVELLGVPGLGPKRVHLLHERLGIDSLKALGAAARAGQLRALPGLGAKTEQKILHALKTRGAEERRFKLAFAEPVVDSLLAHLKGAKGVKQVVVAGSFRRRKETVGDLDILATAAKGAPIVERFIGYEDVVEVVSQGTTRATVILRDGLQVDLRVVPPESYGAALHYFTGNKPHNIAVRKLGQARGLKINEYGVFKGKRRIAGKSEAEVYAQVGLPYIVPELRQGQDELEAARKKALPHLLALKDLRGDLHVHSTASDGRNSIAQMAEAARAKGYRYLAICDHSKRVTIAHGLDARRLARQIAAIDKLNGKLHDFVVLKSSEVDILEDGSLDLPDSILGELDLVIGAVHSKFDLPRGKQTARILRAMDNRHFTILAHPTGRLIGGRPPYEVDMERILMGARERNCFLEVNAQPERLDLNAVHCRMAKQIGVKLAISTDAHATGDLDLMRFGVDQARRGWLEPGEVLNTRSWRALKALIKRA